MLHLRINDLLPEHQSAYRSCHSTESALLKVTSDALLASDQGKLTLLGMLDMSAAFDCIEHIILVRRLNVSFGIDENALEWIVSYITDRRQYVRYNGRTSEYPWLNAAYLKSLCSDRCIIYIYISCATVYPAPGITKRSLCDREIHPHKELTQQLLFY